MVENADGWIPSAEHNEIGPAEVHIWRIALVQPKQVIQHYRTFLAADETARADRYYFEKDRNSFAIARGALREILGTCLNLNPREIHFTYGPQGKPDLAEPHGNSCLRFNLSHSGEVALLAVARNRQLGIDVEQIRPDFATGEIATRFFSPEECARLQTVPTEQRIDGIQSCFSG